MSDISKILQQYSAATLRVETDGAPTFDNQRIVIAGDPSGFRMLAEILNQMADAVSTAEHPAAKVGWQLGLKPGDLPQIKMADGVLVLDCEPVD